MQAGDKIGRYQIQRRLAAGGMAEIFVAKLRGEAGFEKEVVLKRILPQWSSDPDFVAMLIDEAKIAVQLNHPNVIQVYELAREGEVYYITMEYLRSVDLRRLLQKAQVDKKTVPIPIALFIVTEILEGLSYAHARKDSTGHPLHLIHRDISPQNILLSFAGEVKLADFGIAKAASRSQETMTGVLKGKFAYMSPEQANQETLDHRSDLFSLAVVLYEVLTGERLFYRSSDIETLDRVRRGAYEFGPKAKAIPETLKAILERALAKRRTGRYENAGVFRDALVSFAKSSGLDLSRPALVSYLASLFDDGIENSADSQQPTSVLPDSVADNVRTSLFLENTRTAAGLERTPTPEVLAQGIDPATEGTQPPRNPRNGGIRWKWIGGGMVALFILMPVAVRLNLLSKYKNDIDSKRENKLNIKESLEVKKAPSLRPTPPEIPPPEPTVKAEQVLAESRPETRPESRPVAASPVVSLKSEPPEPKVETQKGYLSVQAIPWGVVTVDGGRGRETPIGRLALAPGRHTLQVANGPERAAAAINVIPGREIVCIAKLRGGKTIQCTK